MPEILSPAGVLAATMLLYIPSVFSHTLKCGTTVAKAPGEIHNRTLQTGHWWHPLKSDFHTSLTPNFPSSPLHQHRTPRFSLLSYCTGGMKAAKKVRKMCSEGPSRLHCPYFQRSSGTLESLFQDRAVLILLPLATDWILIAWRGLWQTFVRPPIGDGGGVCVLTSSRRFKVSGGAVPLDVKECLWERVLIKANSTRRALVSGTVLLNNLFH